MSKFKIKTEKGQRIFYDAENCRVSNGHWAIVWQWAKFEMADKKIEGAMAAGKSFTVDGSGSVDFSSKIPDIPAFMEKRWVEVKGTYKRADKTGWLYQTGYRDKTISVEYKTESGKYVYINSEYSKLIDEIGEPLYVREPNEATYCVGDEDSVCGVIMPVKGPDQGRG